MNLIVSTLAKGEIHEETLMETLQKGLHPVEVVEADDLDLKGCIGCNRCWLVTPGVCAIQDDYEKLLIQILQAERVIFAADLKLGFVSYRLKNIIDRFLPLLTMNLRFQNGQMRHELRYQKRYQIGLFYRGAGDQAFLEHWLERVMVNLDGTSLGAYPIENREAICNALIGH